MSTRDQAFKRFISIISKKGQPESVIDKALDLYTRIVKTDFGIRNPSRTGYASPEDLRRAGLLPNRCNQVTQSTNIPSKEIKPTMTDNTKRRWLQTPRGMYDPLDTTPRQQAAPAVTPARSVGNRPLWGAAPALGHIADHKAFTNAPAPVDGYTAAAVKCGVDVSRLPAGTDLTRMNRDQMAALAREQMQQKVAAGRKRLTRM